jgi:hypothetical protein
MTSIAVIGAGISGLAAAARLARVGVRVQVFEKSRGIGGRMATRRIATPAGAAQFDHGAQFFTVREPSFRTAVEGWIAAGAAAQWRAPFTKLTAGAPSLLRDEARFVGSPGMNATAKALAQGLEVTTSARVTALERAAGGWRLACEDARETPLFDAVIVATPAEQAAPLLAPVAPAMAAEASLAVTAPCWAGLFAFDAPVEFPFEALRIADHAVIDWIARDSAKPGRNESLVSFVVHARTDWTRAHLEDAPEMAVSALRAALCEFLGATRTPIAEAAHRWRYAQVERSIGAPFALDLDAKIGACGDWRLGPRVELAFASGDALGAAMAGAFGR